MRPIENRLFEKCGVTPTVAFEVEIDRSIAGLVSAGLGVAIVSYSPDIENFDLKVIRLTEPQYRRYIYMVHWKNRTIPPPVRNFRDFVLERFKI